MFLKWKRNAFFTSRAKWCVHYRSLNTGRWQSASSHWLPAGASHIAAFGPGSMTKHVYGEPGNGTPNLEMEMYSVMN